MLLAQVLFFKAFHLFFITQYAKVKYFILSLGYHLLIFRIIYSTFPLNFLKIQFILQILHLIIPVKLLVLPPKKFIKLMDSNY